MDYIWGSVKLMLFVYGLAACISLVVAWIIRLIFAGIRLKKSPVEADKGKQAPLEPHAAALERKA